jgi:hypothetical protein
LVDAVVPRFGFGFAFSFCFVLLIRQTCIWSYFASSRSALWLCDGITFTRARKVESEAAGFTDS